MNSRLRQLPINRCFPPIPTERIEKFDPTFQLENKYIYSVVASRADFRKSWQRESMDGCREKEQDYVVHAVVDALMV